MRVEFGQLLAAALLCHRRMMTMATSMTTAAPLSAPWRFGSQPLRASTLPVPHRAIHPSPAGMSTFHPSRMNWSYLSLMSDPLTHTKKNIRSQSFARNHRIGQ
jgi:hypothetical protein